MTKQRAAAVVAIVVGVNGTFGERRAAAQKSPLAQAAYTRAQDHLMARRFADAAHEMETAVRYEPRFALGWYVLASASRRAENCDRAVAAYRRYTELRPAAPDPYFGLGLCLQAVGDREAAITAFRRFVEMDTRSESAAFAAIARKQLVELERVTRAVATREQPPSPALIQARELREHGQVDQAIAGYQAAIAVDGRRADAHVELGALLVSARKPRDAVGVLRTAVRLDPAATSGWYNLAFALRETGQTSEAVDAYRRYITFKPKDPDPQYGLGRALVTLGRDVEALAAFRAYVAIETRPTERRWIKKARAEIARIEGAALPANRSLIAPPMARQAPMKKDDATPAPASSAAPPLPRALGAPHAPHAPVAAPIAAPAAAFPSRAPTEPTPAGKP